MPQIPIPTCIHPRGQCEEVIRVETTVTLTVVLQDPLGRTETEIEVDIKVYQVEVTANGLLTTEITDYQVFFNAFTPQVKIQPGQKHGDLPINIKKDAVTQPTNLLFVASCWEYNQSSDAYVVHTMRVEPEARTASAAS